MLDSNDRKTVEAVRRAMTLEIVATSYDGTETHLRFKDKHIGDITKLRHDVAIAIQDHYNKQQSRL